MITPLEVKKNGVRLAAVDSCFAAATLIALMLPTPQGFWSVRSLLLVDQGAVPDPYRRNFAVVTEDADCSGIQQKMLATARGQSDPACREHAQYVSVRKQRGVAIDRTRSGYHPIDSRTHLFWRLAAGTSIAEDQQTRRNLVDLFGCQSLVLAVVPLDQIRIDDGLIAEARELTGLSCPLSRATEDQYK